MLHCFSLADICILSLDRFGPELRNNNAVIIGFTNKVVDNLGYNGRAAGI
jgi:hypothetical protein